MARVHPGRLGVDGRGLFATDVSGASADSSSGCVAANGCGASCMAGRALAREGATGLVGGVIASEYVVGLIGLTTAPECAVGRVGSVAASESATASEGVAGATYAADGCASCSVEPLSVFAVTK